MTARKPIRRIITAATLTRRCSLTVRPDIGTVCNLWLIDYVASTRRSYRSTYDPPLRAHREAATLISMQRERLLPAAHGRRHQGGSCDLWRHSNHRGVVGTPPGSLRGVPNGHLSDIRISPSVQAFTTFHAAKAMGRENVNRSDRDNSGRFAMGCKPGPGRPPRQTAERIAAELSEIGEMLDAAIIDHAENCIDDDELALVLQDGRDRLAACLADIRRLATGRAKRGGAGHG